MKKYIQGQIRFIYLLTILIGIFSGVHGFIDIPETISGGVRWIGILGLIAIGINSNKLTSWIFISMFVGAEIGYDFPTLGNELNVLSKIFIKLIKSIIAPLLFGTLIVGIAGHSNIKQVGRLGWKSLLYFELVTTVALVIGLVAINISKAGVGIVNTGIKEEIPQSLKQQGWKDLVLHVFPENFIKAISEGQVLQIVVFCLFFSISMLFVIK